MMPIRQNSHGLSYTDTNGLERLSGSIGPKQLLQAKLGQRQMPLFPVDVQLLTNARRRSEEQLSPLVEAALETQLR